MKHMRIKHQLGDQVLHQGQRELDIQDKRLPPSGAKRAAGVTNSCEVGLALKSLMRCHGIDMASSFQI